METAKPLLDYGVLGIICFILIAAVSALFWLGWRLNRSYIRELKVELKENREFITEVMAQSMQNNNRIVENNNEMIKGFIDIVSSFKALLNVVIEHRRPEKGL